MNKFGRLVTLFFEHYHQNPKHLRLGQIMYNLSPKEFQDEIVGGVDDPFYNDQVCMNFLGRLFLYLKDQPSIIHDIAPRPLSQEANEWLDELVKETEDLGLYDSPPN